MRKYSILFAILCAVLLVAVPARADVLSLNQTGVLTYQLLVNPLPPDVYVGGFDVDISYNPGTRAPLSVVFANFLGDPNPLAFETLITDDQSVSAIWHIAELSFLPPSVLEGIQPSGGFLLATLTFEPRFVAGGGDGIALVRADVSDQYGNPIGTAPIPEPGSMLLLGSGLAALARWRKKLI